MTRRRGADSLRRVPAAPHDAADARPRVSPRALLLLQLASQNFYFLCLYLFDPRQTLSAAAVAYGTILTLQLVYAIARPGVPVRALTMIATANTVLLFFTAPAWGIAVPIALAWATRTFAVSRGGRPLANAGTYGVFWGGLLSSYVPFAGPPLQAVSHGFTTIPHFQLVVAVLGATLAVLGDHVAIVLALLVGFTITRTFPNAAELIIFLHAAPDPSTSPRRTWQRWMFGLCGGALTGIVWRINGHGNELTKVSGLVAMSLVMPWLGRVDPEPWLRRVLGRTGEAARWGGTRASVAGAALVVLYGALADHFMGFKPFDLWVHFEDARTHERLGRDDVGALLAGNLGLSYAGLDEEVVWSPLNHGWDLAKPTAKHADPVTDVASITLRYRLACQPAVELGDRALVRPRLEPKPRPGLLTVKEIAELTLAVDRDAIRSRCDALR
jgi:hypothetical protein